MLSCAPPMPPTPKQPVRFSHRLHVSDNLIGCPVCHPFAARSPVAGIPSLGRCVGCHRFVDRQKPDVQKINQAFEDRKAIEWVRVNRVPDHVYFTHERHIAAGVRCQHCHGAIEKMDVTRQVHSMSMGWCVDCHRSRGASIGCLTCHK